MPYKIPYKERPQEWKDAYAARNRERRLEKKERWRAYHKEYRLKHIDTFKKRWAVQNKKRRDYQLARTYGMKPGEFDRMSDSQSGLCCICDGSPDPSTKWQLTVAHHSRLQVDHDHLTGKVRGLLCNRCNRAIHLLHDDPEIARRASQYLGR